MKRRKRDIVFNRMDMRRMSISKKILVKEMKQSQNQSCFLSNCDSYDGSLTPNNQMSFNVDTPRKQSAHIDDSKIKRDIANEMMERKTVQQNRSNTNLESYIDLMPIKISNFGYHRRISSKNDIASLKLIGPANGSFYRGHQRMGSIDQSESMLASAIFPDKNSAAKFDSLEDVKAHLR